MIGAEGDLITINVASAQALALRSASAFGFPRAAPMNAQCARRHFWSEMRPEQPGELATLPVNR